MANYNLVNETDPVLDQPAEPWDWTQDGEVAELAQAMMRVMFENNGIGLAAPQIGISKRVLVMGNPALSYICVNPEIISGEGEAVGQEGCLSFPGLWLNVRRHETVKVRYEDILGKQHEREFSGLMARVFQHELDHLNGVCFVDKVGRLSLTMAEKRRKKNLKR